MTTSDSSQKKRSLFIPAAILILVLVAGLGARLYSGWQANNVERQRQEFAALQFYMFNEPRPIANVLLSNMQGESQPFVEHLSGWRLVNFGYMFCPDICPINLASLNQLKKKWDVNNTSTPLEVLHITFDPDRDTPDVLSQYLNYINPSFYGLTGELENIRKIAQQMNMVFIHEKPDENGHYFITHSDMIALINPQGQYVGMFKGPYNTDNMISVLQKVIAH
jgi:protein SCO1/2